MKPKLLKIISAIAVIVFIVAGYLFLIGKTRQVKENMGNITIENIFCGKNYTAEILKINDINVLKRIIELSIKRGDFNNECEFLKSIRGENIGITKRVSHYTGYTDGKQYEIALYNKDDEEQKEDPFNRSLIVYEIDIYKNLIYFNNPFGIVEVLGKFKEETTNR